MLEKIALNTIKQHNLINENDYIIIGVSGGADSICLLYFLNSIKQKFNLKIKAVHINHCMRGEESDGDSLFVQNVCKKLNVPLSVFNFDIYSKAKEENISIEESGRKYRYIAFEKVLKEENATKIAVAHNKNDNAETLVMRFFRGSGIKGLSGISYKRNNIIRPLLDCKRQDIENYCNLNNIAFRDDSTNFMDIYTRNKVRLKLLPYIQSEFNENIVDTLHNMSENFYDENAFLEKITNESLKTCLEEKNKDKIVINLKLFNNFDKVIKQRIIRMCLANFSENLYNLSYEHIKEILSLSNKQTGKKLSLPNKICVYKQYDKLVLCKNYLLSQNSEYNYILELEKPIFIKEINKNVLLSKKVENISTKVYTISINCDKIKNSLFLRQRKAGDKIFLNGMTKKVKNIFIDLKIPTNERNSYPILIQNDNIIGILGLCLCNEYKPTNFNNTIYLHIWEEN